jgi:hypothetical protein
MSVAPSELETVTVGGQRYLAVDLTFGAREGAKPGIHTIEVKVRQGAREMTVRFKASVR